MAHIVDRNLRLILLQSAWDEGLLPRFDKPKFFREQLGIEYDDQADYNYEIDARVLDALLAIPLSEDILRRIKYLEWDGGKEVFAEIWTYWGGTSETFRVRSLEGIETCTGLEELHFIGGGDFTDCSPLSGLPNLSVFRDYSKPIDDLRPLLTLPKLTKLDVRYAPTDENRAVLLKLRERGVQVANVE